MTPLPEIQNVTSDAMKVSWDPQTRIALASYLPDTTLNRKDASVLVEALQSWIGSGHAPFATLGDASGIRGAEPDYRAITAQFYKDHRERLFIALFNVGPLLRIMVEMFRISSGLQFKAFGSEAQAREWLRQKGIPA